MIVNSNGEIISWSKDAEFKYNKESDSVRITSYDDSSITNHAESGTTYISYQEFIEMANEIIRQKENHDATEE